MRSLKPISAMALTLSALVLVSPVRAQQSDSASQSSDRSGSDQNSAADDSELSLAGSQQARAWYQRGVQLVIEKRFLEAQLEFERALRKDPPLDAYFGMGQVELALGRPCEALAAYSKYLELGGSYIPEEKRRGVENHMRQLRQGGGSEESCHPEQRMGMLIAHCDRSDTLLRVDGRNLVIDENLGHRLKAGRHEVVFHDHWGDSTPIILNVDPGSVHYLQCAPQPELKLTSESSAEDQGLSGQQTAGLVVAGAGVGLAVATLSHFFWNHGRHDVWKQNHQNIEDNGGSFEDKEANNALAASIQKANHVTLGLGIASGVLAGAGVTIFLLSPNKDADTKAQMSLLPTDAKSHSVTTLLSAKLSATSAALAWSGSW